MRAQGRSRAGKEAKTWRQVGSDSNPSLLDLLVTLGSWLHGPKPYSLILWPGDGGGGER